MSDNDKELGRSLPISTVASARAEQRRRGARSRTPRRATTCPRSSWFRLLTATTTSGFWPVTRQPCQVGAHRW